MVKKWWILIILSGLLCSQGIFAQALKINVNDKPSLQRGAKIYMNYCSGCHALKYLRYNRMAEDLGLIGLNGLIDKDLLKNNLIFTKASINDPIRIALPPEDAKKWFGEVPPDLSLIARAKGPLWVYTYLNSFYSDNSQPFGVNNLLAPGVAMPNVLGTLVGEMSLVTNTKENLAHLQLIKKGELSQAELKQLLLDLVNFFTYVGEPAQIIRYRLGFMVLAFLLIFLFVAVCLKNTYWRKITGGIDN